MSRFLLCFLCFIMVFDCLETYGGNIAALSETTDNFVVETWINYDWGDNNWVFNSRTDNYLDDYGNRLQDTFKIWNGSDWEIIRRNVYIYNANHKCIEITSEIWADGEWQPDNTSSGRKDIYEYDDIGNLVSTTIQKFISNEWQNYMKYCYYFNEKKLRIRMVKQNWMGDAWENDQMNETVYDDNDRVSRQSYYEWQMNKWANIRRYDITYGSNGEELERILYEGNLDEWQNKNKSTYIYNSKFILLETDMQAWTNGEWVNDTKTSFIYDENDMLIEQIDQSWNGNGWDNSLREITKYTDGNGSRTVTCQIWGELGWTNDSSTDDIRDVNGNTVEIISRMWLDDQVMNISRTEYRYRKFTSVSENSNPSGINIEVYPNPFTETTEITVSLPEQANVNIDVYDIAGNIVYSYGTKGFTEGINKLTFDGSSLQPGVYFLKLEMNERVYTKKVVMVK